ncbi:hypothetical protein AB0L53_59155 [Nonomuraea sp. NPDC052129]|uniref:hypothetical protein n=1 Tax=Nonomuraea sp. NPDC052129 TaxID=3154651 RepID=UPI00341DF25E
MEIKRIATFVVVCLGVAAGCSGQGAVRSSPPIATPSAAKSTGAGEVVTRSEQWGVIEGPKLSASAGLVDVVADGPRRAWAVGYEDGAEDRAGNPIVERWDGSAWKKATPSSREFYVSGFDVDGADDIWIVGEGDTAHWDGQRWSYPQPSGLQEDQTFTDVSIDRGRAVLIGEEGDTSFAVEWAGGRFGKRAVVSGRFAAVTARRDQVWVVGAALRDGCSAIRPAVWHASPGTGYAEMTVPDVPGGYLSQVWQISEDDVWAVGGIGGEEAPLFGCQAVEEDIEQSEPLVMHWDGSSWRREIVPGGAGPLGSVTAFGPDDVWAIGPDRGDAMVALHFNGRAWAREYAYARRLDRLAVTAIPGTSQLWAVGTAGAESDYGQDVILRRRRPPS